MTRTGRVTPVSPLCPLTLRWQYCQQLETIMEEHKHLHKTHVSPGLGSLTHLGVPHTPGSPSHTWDHTHTRVPPQAPAHLKAELVQLQKVKEKWLSLGEPLTPE